MNRMPWWAVAVAMCASIVAGRDHVEELPLSPERAEMARVFARAWTSENNSVGIYSGPTLDDIDYNHGGKNFPDVLEMDERGYEPMLLRQRLKGNPPELFYYNSGFVVCGNTPKRPFIMARDARLAVVLRRLAPDEKHAERLEFLVPNQDGQNEPFVAEEDYAGIGCLEWPERDSRGQPVWDAPDYLLPLSEAELEDWRRCGEWFGGKSGATDPERPSPATSWGREVFTFLELQD